MKTPLNEVPITCADCQEEYSAQDINDGIIRFHDPKDRRPVRFPAIGITPADIATLPGMKLLCEICHENPA